ncbi:MAG: shikimate kinase [Rhizobiaceae bacterium]|nr:shikimate kinase [Rhizobiaceae bacterium]
MPQNEKMHSAGLVDGLEGKSIVLVGMMGCGKTAIGRIVASQLGLQFYDADEEIEVAAGMKVAEYFSTYGEEEFRIGERKVIARLLNDNQCVLALGGGAFLSQETRKCVSQNALSVWLRADLDILFSRVMRRPGKRPLLNTADPKKTLAELLKNRESFYGKADIIVDTSNTSKNVTRDWVIAAISKYLGAEKN